MTDAGKRWVATYEVGRKGNECSGSSANGRSARSYLPGRLLATIKELSG